MMPENFSDKTQKISRPEKKKDFLPGDIRLDTAELHPQLPDKELLYENGEILGEGGQGIVFRAKDKSLDRIVAVKSLRAELLGDERARKSFLAEAKITAQLEHPAIVPIYSLTGDEKNGLHLAMKILRGVTLADHLDETCRRYRENGIAKYDENTALRDRLELFLRVCDALSYVHHRNLMHRDLKPGNIIIGEYREVYLIDWGIAAPIRDTDPGAPPNTLGTPPYMAPEVLAKEASDQRADIFALGVILFDIVFLKSAFSGTTPEELISQVTNCRSNSFCHAFGVGVSRELAAIVKKAMAFDKTERYQTVGELSGDLRKFLAGEENTALPDRFFGKVSRAMMKHRNIVTAGVALLLLAFLGNTAWNFYRQRNDEIARRQYENALTQLSAKTARVAYQIEKKFGALESLMREFSAEAAARMDFPPPADAPKPAEFISDEAAHRDPGVHFSSYYGHWLQIDRAALRMAAKNVDEKRAKKEIAQLAPAMEKIVPRFLETGSTRPDEKKSLPLLKGEMLRDGNMMLWFYIASEAGFLLQYPGSDALPGDYDPRDRNWFIAGKAFADDQLHWGKPYLGLQVKKRMMTCTQACRKGERLLGVCALDVILERFREIMTQYGADAAFTEARLLLDADGNVLVSADRNGKPVREMDSDPLVNIRSTGYRALYRAAMKKGFGDTTGTVRGRKKLFLFFPVRKMKWLYAEVIDLERLPDAKP